MDDLNYNIKVTFDDNSLELVYATKLHNEDLDHWQGWHCMAGVNAIYIYENTVYGGECKNDLLGNLNSEWNLIENYAVCQRDRCSGCTIDIMQEKYKP